MRTKTVITIVTMIICTINLKAYNQVVSSDYFARQANYGNKEQRLEHPKPDSTPQERSARAYLTTAQMADMSTQDLVDALLATAPWDVQSPSASDDSKRLYGDSTKIIAISEALKIQCASFGETTVNSIGAITKVLQAGSYIAFYSDDPAYAYLKNMSFKKKYYADAARIAVKNVNFSTLKWPLYNGVKYIGDLIGCGYVDKEIIDDASKMLKEYVANFEKPNVYGNGGYYTGSGFASVANGIAFCINTDLYKYGWDGTKSVFYNQMSNYIDALKPLALYNDHSDKNKIWGISATIYYVGVACRVMPKNDAVAMIDQIIAKQTPSSGPYVRALIFANDDLANLCHDENGNLLTKERINQIRETVKAKLFPKTFYFGKNSKNENSGYRCKFVTGKEVTDSKIKTLFSAISEVRSHFLRSVNADQPIDAQNRDSMLTAYVFGTKQDYIDYQYFLHSLGTDNGGMYIEGDGTFYTFERTASESSLSVEELFRHEFTHYLQGRYLVKGMWGSEEIYEGSRMVWFEEGGAEYFAGSLRVDSVLVRQNMVTGVNISSLPSPYWIMRTTYDSGITAVYNYSWCLFTYLAKKRPDILTNFVKLSQAGDVKGWDAYRDQIAPVIETDFKNYIQSLINSIDKLTDITTLDSYTVSAEPKITTVEVREKIEYISNITNVKRSVLTNTLREDIGFNYHIYEVKGDYLLGDSEGAIKDIDNMNKKLATFLRRLSDDGGYYRLVYSEWVYVTTPSWDGFNTYTTYFSDYKVENGKAYFKLTFNGSILPEQIKDENFSDIANEDGELLQSVELAQNYPNPFNPETTISFKLNQDNAVSLVVMNVKGEVVKNLLSSNLKSGKYDIVFNANNLTSGIYFYQLKVGNKTEIKKMALIK